MHARTAHGRMQLSTRLSTRVGELGWSGRHVLTPLPPTRITCSPGPTAQQAERCARATAPPPPLIRTCSSTPGQEVTIARHMVVGARHGEDAPLAKVEACLPYKRARW